jgi:hypothetical protein
MRFDRRNVFALISSLPLRTWRLDFGRPGVRKPERDTDELFKTRWRPSSFAKSRCVDTFPLDNPLVISGLTSNTGIVLLFLGTRR